MKCKSSLIWLIQFFVVVGFLFFRECFRGPYLKYSSWHHSGLIRWSRQSFSWSTLSAQNAGWCAPPSCRAWAGAPSDWSSSTLSTADSDTERTPEVGRRKRGGRGRKRHVNKTHRKILWCEGVRVQDRNDITQVCRKVYLRQLFLSDDSGGEDKMLRFLEKILKSRCILLLKNTQT